MDIWEKMYEEAQKLYNPHEVSDFVYANHVVAAVEAEDGQIFTGFCMEREPVVFSISAQNGRHSSICTNSRDKLKLKSLSFSRQNHLMVEVRVCLVALAESSS